VRAWWTICPLFNPIENTTGEQRHVPPGKDQGILILHNNSALILGYASSRRD
jgi:hypothetical protein